jgi:hypothetical protein
MSFRPGGTIETCCETLRSRVPPGRKTLHLPISAAVNCWAIIISLSGTKTIIDLCRTTRLKAPWIFQAKTIPWREPNPLNTQRNKKSRLPTLADPLENTGIHRLVIHTVAEAPERLGLDRIGNGAHRTVAHRHVATRAVCAAKP